MLIYICIYICIYIYIYICIYIYVYIYPNPNPNWCRSVGAAPVSKVSMALCDPTVAVSG